MKTLVILALLAALPLSATTVTASERAPASATVTGQKLDSGLGELPHYRLWFDRSGKDPMGTQAAVSMRYASAKSAAQPTAKPSAKPSERFVQASN